jgi:probable HAF family extracellular repeat protein
MKRNSSAYVSALALFATLAITSQLAAQQPRYRLIDMGTFDGDASELNNGGDGNNAVTVLNNRGELVGWAATPTHDPFDPFCLDEACRLIHAFKWQNGTRTDLGTLPGGANSQAVWISSNGLVAGISENGETDPLLPGFPELHGVLWRDGRITDLKTLPEGGYESFANAVNSRGQVVGGALNKVSDFPNSMAGPGLFPTQTRAFLWQDGVMKDLDTLGGPDAMAQFISERGQVVGWSYTSSATNTSCPFFLPLATGSFIWDEKNGMRNLGTLGGTCVIATGVSDNGLVVGDNVNNEPIQRAFIWKDGIIQDLGGTIGGNQAGAEGINETGQIVGFATLAGELLSHATLWRGVGEMTDLGVLDGDLCSFASSINSKAQTVGASQAGTQENGCTFDNTTSAVLWENGSIFDLNTLIPPGASLHLQWAEDINDRGEIAGTGSENGNLHAFLLIPCAANTPSDCQEVIVSDAHAQRSAAPILRQPIARRVPLRQMLHR